MKITVMLRAAAIAVLLSSLGPATPQVVEASCGDPPDPYVDCWGAFQYCCCTGGGNNACYWHMVAYGCIQQGDSWPSCP